MKGFNSLPPLFRVPLKFGLVASVLSVAIMIVLFYTGRHPSLVPPYLDSRILIFLIFIYFAIREFKEFYNNRYLHFWQGLIIGVTVYLAVGIAGGLFIFIFGKLETSFVAEYINMAREGVMAAKDELINGPQGVKMTEQEFANHLASLENTTAGILAVDYFIKSCIVGFFIPLLYSALFRKVER